MRLLLITILGVFGFGCGSDPEERAPIDGVEILFPDAVDLDTHLSDIGTDIVPDSVLADSMIDTAQADTAQADTGGDSLDTTEPDTFTDTTAMDTTVSDTTVSDTTVSDTTVADTTVADTAEPDTTVADTTVADAVEPDTTPECQTGGCVTDVGKLGSTCATAFVIGRPNAQEGFGHMSSTIGAGNNSDFPQAACGDSGPDRFYKIYLKVGEQLWVNANPSPATYDLTYGLYRGENCETPVTCVDNDQNGTTPDTMPYQAVVEGWHVLVVDGRNTQGDYSLVVTLDCQEADCCCR
jgi:hypothetical protein